MRNCWKNPVMVKLNCTIQADGDAICTALGADEEILRGKAVKLKIQTDAGGGV
jgi:hypothetical protein